MDDKKNNNINSILGISVILLVIVVISLVIYILYISNNGLNINTTNANSNTTNNTINNNDTSNNNSTESNNNTNSSTVTKNYIANENVKKVYEMIKFESSLGAPLKTSQNVNSNVISKRVGLILVRTKDTKGFTVEQLDYIHKNYSASEYVTTERGYYDANEIIKKLKEYFDMDVSKENFASLTKSELRFGIMNNYVYDSKIDGFLIINIPTGCSGPKECISIVEEVFNYSEHDNVATIDSRIAYTDGYELYTDEQFYHSLRNDFNSSNFKFTDDEIEKVSKIRYTFNKRADGSYYFVDVKPLNN